VPYEQREGSGGGGHAYLANLAQGAYEFSPLADAGDVYTAVKDPSLKNLSIAGLAVLGGPPGDILKQGIKRWKIVDRIKDRGEVGNRSHITLVEKGTAPTEEIASYGGARGEVRGKHRNRIDEEWEDFKKDISENGIRDPIFITVDHNGAALISEGNHRIDAAVEVGLENVPVEIRYFGVSESQGTLSQRGLGGKPR
jgi:hypothetical protein